ncbi:TetR/AcrR family transcriptional regulator [Paraconexibacter algicola]|uniref:HTH tetR-type domain-containing protein n=1 Tax=Paraconexibacter algicola TaxID=2133960 RepID=A0A2T4UL61_9ACTN|nr:TetR/AcrR family transcriptional regulator [Paraconexibacter algicola]PTL59938.1 hypothetical protein C7Y72_09920 [Paraconexibacter algicola]
MHSDPLYPVPTPALLRLVGDEIPAPDAADPDLDRLLDVAVEELVRYGVARTSLADIARKAGVSRPTAYRKLGGKDELLQRILVREVLRFYATLERSTAGVTDPADRAVAAFSVGLVTAHRHPLVSELLEHEPSAVVPYLTTEGTSMLSTLTDIVTEFIDPGETLGAEVARRKSEVVVRLSWSFFLTPRGAFGAPTEATVDQLADTVVRAAFEAA